MQYTSPNQKQAGNYEGRIIQSEGIIKDNDWKEILWEGSTGFLVNENNIQRNKKKKVEGSKERAKEKTI